MNISQFFPSKYVKAPDLNGRNITVAIDRLEVERVGVPPKVEDKLVLYFRNATKGMILNRTNAMTIAAMYSPESDNWTGQRITLYSTRVNAFGAMHDVIRIRPEVPPAPKAGAAAEVTQFDDAEDVIDDEDVDEVMATGVPIERNIDTETGEILDDAPPTPEQVIASWDNSAQMFEWAIAIGACANHHEAKNSWSKIVEAHGGKVNADNRETIRRAFYDRQQEKLAATPAAQPEPLPA